MNLILFKGDAQDFNSNGIGILVDAISDEITEDRNGQLELYFEYPDNGIWVDEIKDNRIVRGKPSDRDEPHNFRIYEIRKSLDTGTILVSATSKTNDLGGNLVVEFKGSGTPQRLMTQALGNLVEPTDINFISDIQTESAVNWVRRSPLNCIAGEQGSLVQIFGGEIKRTDRTIYLYARRGQDSGMVVRQGRHIDGFKLDVNTRTLVTRILPFFSHTPEGENEEVTITGSVVDSPLVNNYPTRNIIPVDYSGEEDVTDLSSLNAKASEYFTYQNPDIDKPNVTIEVDMAQLSESPEYAKFKGLESIGLTDIITVYVPKHNVDVKLKVTSITYSSIKEQTLSLVAGSNRPTFYDTITGTYRHGLSELQKHVDGLRNTVQMQANQKNRIFRGVDKPTSGMIENDLWYQPVGDGEIILWNFNGAIWKVEKISAGLLGGTLDAENGDVNLINVNVANIVGETSEFVRSAWNAIGESVMIDASGFHSAKTTDGITNEIKLSDGQILLDSNASGIPTEVLLDGQGLEFTTDAKKARMRFNGTNLVLDANLGLFGNHINSVSWIRMIGGYETTIHKHPTDDGGALVDSTKLTIGLGIRDEFHDIARFYGRIDFLRNLHLNGNNIQGVSSLAFEGSSTMLAPSIGNLGGGVLMDGTAITIGQRDGSTLGFSRLAEFYGRIEFFRNLHMNGNDIIESSDRRLKTDIQDTKQDSLAMVRSFTHKDFRFIDSHNQDIQLGLIAQDVHESLVDYNEEKDIYGINQSRLIHTTTHALKQLAVEVDELRTKLEGMS